jgi:hypothetical protein
MDSRHQDRREFLLFWSIKYIIYLVPQLGLSGIISVEGMVLPFNRGPDDIKQHIVADRESHNPHFGGKVRSEFHDEPRLKSITRRVKSS